MSLILFECEVWDPVDAATKTIRIGTGAYNHPSAPGFYADRIVADSVATGTITRSVWDSDTEYGAGRLDVADVDVANLDGWLDWLVTNGVLFGRTARLLLLADASASYSSAVAIATGIVEGASFAWDRVVFRWRDEIAALLDRTLQTVKYAGSNVLPDGVEGVDDLKGQSKPYLQGVFNGVPAPCVNTSKRVYQLSVFGNVQYFENVADRGVFATKGVQRATLADLLSTAPAAGTWDYCASNTTGAAGSFIRLGWTPQGQITCSGACFGEYHAAALWHYALLDSGITSPVSTADLAAVKTASGPGLRAGYWLGPGDTAQRREVIDNLAATIGCVYYVDAAGTWRMKRPDVPSGTPAATFSVHTWNTAALATDGDVLDFEWVLPGNGDANPVYEVTLSYANNPAVSTKDSLGGAASASLAPTADTYGLQWLTQEWRRVTSSDAATLTACPLARQIEGTTYLADLGAPGAANGAQLYATTEAARRLAMFKRTGPRRARMRVKYGPATASAVDLMSVVKVQLPRFGMAAGRLALVTSIALDWRSMTAELGLYF